MMTTACYELWGKFGEIANGLNQNWSWSQKPVFI